VIGAATLYGLCGAALVGIGLHGLVARPEVLRKILAFNLIGSGVFLVFGAVAGAGPASDPVPQAMVITGIVVALSATALAVALALRMARETGRETLPPEPPPDGAGRDG
jgi:multicomponent Na+:H+ antiporter subunit C